MFRIVPFDKTEHAALLGPITELLHAAYAPLAAEGLHYVASHQPPEKTLDRLTEGRSWIFYCEEELAGTISLYEGARKRISTDYYRRPGVFLFGQFAVAPKFQGRGLASRVMDFVEVQARILNAVELALDTSEKATRLQALYAARGYAVVAETQWPDVNYRSVIMSKRL